MHVMENNYVYVCGSFYCEKLYKSRVLKVYVSEIDAVNEMMRLCKSDDLGGFRWLFYDCDVDIDNLNIKTYQQFNDFVKNNCINYYNIEFYFYIQRVILE